MMPDEPDYDMTLAEALTQLDDLTAAYIELRHQYARLQLALGNAQTALGHARYAIKCDLWLAEQPLPI